MEVPPVPDRARYRCPDCEIPLDARRSTAPLLVRGSEDQARTLVLALGRLGLEASPTESESRPPSALCAPTPIDPTWRAEAESRHLPLLEVEWSDPPPAESRLVQALVRALETELKERDVLCPDCYGWGRFERLIYPTDS